MTARSHIRSAKNAIRLAALLLVLAQAVPLTASANFSCPASLVKFQRVEEVFETNAPYEVQIAAAEYLAQHGGGNRSANAVIADAQLEAFLRAVVMNRLTPSQAQLADQYRPFMKNLVLSSKAVDRLRILENYKSDASVPETRAESLAFSPEPVKETKGMLSRWLKKAPPSPKIEYLNAEQFGRALETQAPDQRLAILESSIGGAPLMTHIEAFRILYAFPSGEQTRADALVRSKLIGRLDFLPLVLAETAVASIELSVIAGHIRDTGGGFELGDLIGFYRKNGASDATILDWLPKEALSASAVEKMVEADPSVSMDEAYFYLNLLSRSAHSYDQMESGQNKIASKISNETQRNDFNTRYRIMIQGSAFAVDMDVRTLKNRAAIQPAAQTLDDINELLGQYEGRLNGRQAFELLTTIPAEQNLYANEKPLLSMRDRLRAFMGNPQGHSFTATDLHLMGVSRNIDLAHRILASLKSATITADQREGLRQQVWRLFGQGHLTDLRDNSHKPKLPPPRERGATVNNVQRYFESLIAGMRIEN